MANYNLKGQVWGHTTITYSFATANYGSDVQPAQFSSTGTIGNNFYRDEIRQAFARWAQVTPLTFVETTDSSTVDIRLGYAALDGRFNTLGVESDYYSNGYFKSGVVIRFDQAEVYTISGQDAVLDNSGVTFFSVALHEIGHALGLGHYDGGPAIMRTSLSSSITDLQQSDLDGIHALYGFPQSDLVANAFTVPSTLYSGQTVSINVSVANRTGTAGAFNSGLYFSNDAAFSGDDFYANQINYPNGLAAGATASDTLSVGVPGGFGNGTRYIIFYADNFGSQSESNESNNTSIVGFNYVSLLTEGSDFARLPFAGTWNAYGGNDYVIGTAGVDIIDGGAGDDTLDGAGGNDTLRGGDGDDELIGGAGGDSLIGGNGSNTASYVSAGGPVSANLSNVGANAGDAVGDTYSGIQNLKGSGGGDTLTGDSQGNVLSGLYGGDVLYGVGGADALNGGQGIDTLFGGANNDRFIFDNAALPDSTGYNFDFVADYNRGFYGFYYAPENDLLDVSGIVSGAYAAGQPANQLVRLVESQDGGYANLQVDRDGSAGGVSWTTVARVVGRHESETASVIVYPNSPAISITSRENAGLTGDFDGDGRSDALFRNDNGNLAIWLLNGTTIAGSGSPGGPSNAWHVVGVGDFGGDGKSDILFRNNDNTLAMWTMNGTSIAAGAELTSKPGADWHVAAVADFSGDGKADMLWRNDNGALSIWRMNGSTIIDGPQLQSAPGPEWHVVGTGDFNGDQKADILWRHDNGTVAMWLMNGSSILAGPQLQTVDPYWHIAGVLDVNGDNRDDILWRHENGNVHVWAMNGAGVIGAGDIGAPDQSWQIAGTGDFNKDGRDDILWRNVNGTVAEWQLLGNAITGGANIGGPGNDWKIQTHDYEYV